MAAPASRERGADCCYRRWVHPCTAPTCMAGIAPGDPGHEGAPQSAPRSRLARTTFLAIPFLCFGGRRVFGNAVESWFDGAARNFRDMTAQTRLVAGTARSYPGRRQCRQIRDKDFRGCRSGWSRARPAPTRVGGNAVRSRHREIRWCRSAPCARQTVLPVNPCPVEFARQPIERFARRTLPVSAPSSGKSPGAI